jgi:hypothetical protein
MAEPAYIRELREILCEWDPIGVFSADADWPKDEYDGLIGPLLGRLQAGADAGAVQDYLMGLDGYFGSTCPRRLLVLRNASLPGTTSTRGGR